MPGMGRVRKMGTKERSDYRGVLKCDRSPPNCKCKGQRHLQYLKCSEGGAITFRMLLFSDLNVLGIDWRSTASISADVRVDRT